MAENFFQTEYKRIAQKTWSPITAGLILGLLSIYMFLYARPWGVFDGARNWGENLLYILGLWGDEQPVGIFDYTTSISDIGLLLGAFVAALLGGKVGIHLVKPRDYVFGLIGGALMGVGGSLAMGCNVGGFYSAFASLSFAGPLMMLGLLIGAYLGAQFYLWDLEHHPRPPVGVAIKSFLYGEKSRKIQPFIGLVIGVGVVIIALRDESGFSYRGVEGKKGMLLLLALAVGILLQRSRFCFARAFREPFLTGSSKMTQGAAIALITCLIGFALIKGTDLADYRPEEFFVNPSVWLGSLIGGIIFGFGMVTAGGCASGSLWRAAEGQVRLWCSLLTFSISAALMGRYVLPKVQPHLGKAIYAPDILGFLTAVLLFLFIAIFWYFLARYNEKSEKFVIR